MKDKKGFVFIETIIVIATILAGLLAIYISYTNMVRNERRRVRYDEPSFIYRTYSIGQFLLSMYDDDGNSILYNKVDEYKNNPNINSYYFNIPTNDIDFFSPEYVGDNSSRKGFYEKMFNDLHIQNVIVISKSKIDDINNKYNGSNTEKEKIVNLIPNNLLYYLLSLNIVDDDDGQVYLVVEFAEKVNGDQCSPNQLADASSSSDSRRETSCTFYYANMKLEGV